MNTNQEKKTYTLENDLLPADQQRQGNEPMDEAICKSCGGSFWRNEGETTAYCSEGCKIAFGRDRYDEDFGDFHSDGHH